MRYVSPGALPYSQRLIYRQAIKTKIPGVRYREHKTRKFGIQKDRYFFIVYQLNKKQKEEGVREVQQVHDLGWWDGWIAL